MVLGPISTEFPLWKEQQKPRASKSKHSGVSIKHPLPRWNVLRPFWEKIKVTLYQGYISDLQRLRGYKKVPLSITLWLIFSLGCFPFKWCSPKLKKSRKDRRCHISEGYRKLCLPLFIPNEAFQNQKKNLPGTREDLGGNFDSWKKWSNKYPP